MTEPERRVSRVWYVPAGAAMVGALTLEGLSFFDVRLPGHLGLWLTLLDGLLFVAMLAPVVPDLAEGWREIGPGIGLAVALWWREMGQAVKRWRQELTGRD